MHVVDLTMDESVSTQQLPAPAPAPNSGKKLKQSRLPFLVLSPGTSSSIGSLQSESATGGEPVETRKRKPSCDGNHGELHLAKVVRTSARQSNDEELIVVAKSDPEVIIVDEAETPTAVATVADSSPGGESVKPAGTDAEDGSSPDKADPTDQQMVVSSSEEDVYALCTPNKEETSVSSASEKPAAKKISAKQLARRLEHERKLALKEQERQEKRRRLQEEKEEKAREKEELERQRRKEREEREEQKRREREEREEAKRKEREEKEKRRQSEIEQKNEEKRLKEEERRRKEEEREAEEKRKQKAQAQVFSRFFVKKTPANGSTKASDDENSIDSIRGGEPGMVSDRFMPFCVKGDMRMAPVTRRTLSQSEKDRLQTLFGGEATKDEIPASDLYLGLLKRNCIQPLKTGPTWITEAEEDDDDITIIDETTYQPIVEDHATLKQKMKAKFFLFEENRRPPYRGTWRKRSTIVRPRRPFSKDTKYFDYEVDSDDEWEEEEPGESLHGSDDEKDVDAEEDYEVDNDFFVPHGHLSDEEMQAEDEDEAPDADNSPEAQKAKLKILQQEFAAEMKKKTEKIKPRLIGCIWQQHREGGADRTADCSTLIMKILSDRAMLYDPSEPISFTQATATVPEGAGTSIDRDLDSPGKENKKAPKKGRISDGAVGDLARLVHGNVNNRKFLVREFQAFWANRGTANEGPEATGAGETTTSVSASASASEFSMESIRNKIKEIATWGACPLEGPMHGKHCWTVDEAVLKDYNLTQLQLPNAWVYHLKGSNPSRSSKLAPAKPVATSVDEEN
ncbi:chromatin assembly factor 1 subunit A-like [Anopheles albimanus]|nr:chromatin assembly factor 1 subunit A-like [Anopheles albimanus]